MKKWTRVTKADKNDMFEGFDSGLTLEEVMELTGRCRSVVCRYKRKWKEERNMIAPAIVEEPEVKEEKSEEVLSDYAKAYYADDPAFVRSSFDIKRSIQIRSKKTGILYEMDDTVKDKKVLNITLADGTSFKIELGLFEKFVDEGIDVVLEIKKTA